MAPAATKKETSKTNAVKKASAPAKTKSTAGKAKTEKIDMEKNEHSDNNDLDVNEEGSDISSSDDEEGKESGSSDSESSEGESEETDSDDGEEQQSQVKSSSAGLKQAKSDNNDDESGESGTEENSVSDDEEDENEENDSDAKEDEEEAAQNDSDDAPNEEESSDESDAELKESEQSGSDEEEQTDSDVEMEKEEEEEEEKEEENIENGSKKRKADDDDDSNSDSEQPRKKRSVTLEERLPIKGEEGEHEYSVFVGQIPYEATEEDVRQLFSQIGRVIDVDLPKYNATKNRGFGHVKFSKKKDVSKALKKDGELELQGRKLAIKEAKPIQGRKSIAERSSIKSNTMFVGNLAYSVKEDDIRQVCSKFGDVQDIRHLSQSGVAFVTFNTVDQCTKAIDSLSGMRLQGRPLRTDYDSGSKKKGGAANSTRGQRGGRGGRGGFRGRK